MTQTLPSNRTKWNDVSDANLLNHPHFLDGQTTAGSKWLSVSRLITYGLITLILFPSQIIGLLIYPPLRKLMPLLHHKFSASVIGLRIKTTGHISRSDGVLFVSNHLSYFDIIILGSLIPGRFIAKSEVAKWPILGLLAKATRTIFIKRQKNSSRLQKKLIKQELENLENLILFPEGTSTDGRKVLPFKSSLFEAPKLANSTVQPITIRYTHLNGIPITYRDRPFFSWYGDMEFVPHLITALSLGVLKVEVKFHAPIGANQFADRKKLAVYCHKKVANKM